MAFPCSSDGKASACSAGDPGSIPGSGRSPGGGNGNPLQCSCLENPRDGGAWGATVRGVTKSRTRLTLSLPFHPSVHCDSTLGPAHILSSVAIHGQRSFVMCTMHAPLSGFICLLLGVHVGSHFSMFLTVPR